jgi:5-methylcytosine-specific restriction endonuclease McrA
MAKKISYYRNKADKAMQEWGRMNYKKCLVCPKKMSCLHHYYPKSTSSALRYDQENLIPICQGCHMQHHNGNPAIHNKVNEIKGDKWLKDLQRKKEKIVKVNKLFYEEIIRIYGKTD